MKLGWILLVVAIIAVMTFNLPAGQPASISRPKWEYGRLSAGVVMVDGIAVPKVRWRSASADQQAVDFRRLYPKIGGSGVVDDDPLVILNLLGADGWEFIGEHVVRTEVPLMESTEYLFKRPR